jgi:hypothetical protein
LFLQAAIVRQQINPSRKIKPQINADKTQIRRPNKKRGESYALSFLICGSAFICG